MTVVNVEMSTDKGKTWTVKQQQLVPDSFEIYNCHIESSVDHWVRLRPDRTPIIEGEFTRKEKTVDNSMLLSSGTDSRDVRPGGERLEIPGDGSAN